MQDDRYGVTKTVENDWFSPPSPQASTYVYVYIIHQRFTQDWEKLGSDVSPPFFLDTNLIFFSLQSLQFPITRLIGIIKLPKQSNRAPFLCEGRR